MKIIMAFLGLLNGLLKMENFMVFNRPITSLSGTLIKKKLKWQKLVERESDFWKNYMMISSTGDVKKLFGCTIKERLTTRRGMTFTHWMNPKAVWDCSLQIEKKLKRNPEFIDKVERVFAESRKELLAVNKRLETINFDNLNNKQLFALYRQFCKVYQGLYPAFHLAVYIDSIEHKTKEWLSYALAKIKQSQNFDNYFIRLTALLEFSLIQEEELALTALAVKIIKQGLDKAKIEELLDEHTSKFAGLPVVNDETEPWNKEYFQHRLKVLLSGSKNKIVESYEKLSAYPAHVKRDQAAIFKELSAPPFIKIFFRLIGLSTWIRLVSRSSFAMAHYSSRNLFSEIGRRNNLTAEEVKWLSPNETKNLIFTGHHPNVKKLNARKFAAVLLFRNGKYRILEGKPADRFIREEVEEVIQGDKANFVKGSVAYLGLVKGRAKIILSQKNISKMEEGDVLIARMTTPEIIPAVRLATAIVTDEGGITCHAAIVSRELKIPCVVGTKHATKMFKDGDLIQVDANKGIVNLIKPYERKNT